MLERAIELDSGLSTRLARPRPAILHRISIRQWRRAMMARYDAAMERALSLDPNYVAAAAGLIVSRVERGELVAAHQNAADLVARRPTAPTRNSSSATCSAMRAC